MFWYLFGMGAVGFGLGFVAAWGLSCLRKEKAGEGE